MKFALVNNERTEATPGAKGICPVCGSLVIAKCGEKKVHHWAHKTRKNCKNNRWETEGEWHQKWKNKFPKDWQEKIVIINGEKNIADIQNEQGFVVEFQHSHINPEEKRAREQNYKNMVWVVDGTRLKNDLPRFQKNIENNTRLYLTAKPDFRLFSISWTEEIFPKDWINNTVPVLFDFSGLSDNDTLLYCLLPNNFIFMLSKSQFISEITTNHWQQFYSDLQDAIKRIAQQNKQQQEILSNIQANCVFNQLTRHLYRGRYHRRF